MSAQAGASHVIALEASSMAEKIELVRASLPCRRRCCSKTQLVKGANSGSANPHMRDKIRVVRGMVEDQTTQEEVLRSGKVDTIISEPIGVMLLHERMVRIFSYLHVIQTPLKLFNNPSTRRPSPLSPSTGPRMAAHARLNRLFLPETCS
jgi:hypothetical protein